MGLLCPSTGQKRFQVGEHVTLEWWLHSAVALQDRADTNLTGGELCLQIKREHPLQRLQVERSR
jgi:hypothetical protein